MVPTKVYGIHRGDVVTILSATDRWRIASHLSPSWPRRIRATKGGAMNYSVWADGVRIGETRLELRPSPRRRTGEFHPTATGRALLADIAGWSARHRLEVRDPAGIPIRYDSIAITDVERLIAAACARRPTPTRLAAEGIHRPISFVISLTLDLRASDSSSIGATSRLASCRGG
jgi:hypothetical protein